MKPYKDKLTLNKNSRGCYILDTVKGCIACTKEKPNGCYDNCYASNIANRYGFDFQKPVIRGFERDKEQLFMFDLHDTKHEHELIKAINKINMPFIRIGEMGDPSFSWEHTLEVCKIIAESKKAIVIITKHFKVIPDYLLMEIKKLNICINTSISALDDEWEVSHRLNQYNKLKDYCNSALRIVSCNFNLENEFGYYREKIQSELFKNENIIDTIFRPNANNPLIINKIIKTKKVLFLKKEVLASIYNENTYLGYCNSCPNMCGIK